LLTAHARIFEFSASTATALGVPVTEPAPPTTEPLAGFLAASIAVWREIDRLDAEPDGYHPIRMSVELRQRERAAWERYRDHLDGVVPAGRGAADGGGES
jgi:hypothetical protein